jgi:hypothetical protein
MNMLVGALTFVPLLTIAFAHVLWTFGNTWPIRNQALLAQTVVGLPGATRMPSRMLTFATALFTLAAGIVALSLADHDSGGLMMSEIGGILAVVFFARGVLGYTQGWRAKFSAEPFATNDRKTYSPLCLWIGVGFFLLVLMRLL